MRDIYTLANQASVAVVPHSAYFGPGLVATAHVTAALSRAPLVERLYCDLLRTTRLGRRLRRLYETRSLWSAATGEFLIFLRGHKRALRTAVFAPDSRTVLTSGDDGTVRTYACSVCGTRPELIRLAERRLAQTRTR